MKGNSQNYAAKCQRRDIFSFLMILYSTAKHISLAMNGTPYIVQYPFSLDALCPFQILQKPKMPSKLSAKVPPFESAEIKRNDCLMVGVCCREIVSGVG